MDKLYSLQILRGIAAWSVVFHHYMQLFYNFQADSWLGKLFHTRGNFGVDVFFILSGFLMYIISQNNSVSATTFWFKRVIRVMPAYWFFTSCLIIFLILFPMEFSFTDFNSGSLLKSYFLIPSMNPSGIGVIPFLTVGWTLIFEMVFYTALSISLFLSRKYAISICLVLIGAAPFIFPGGNLYSHVLGEFKIYQFLVGILIGIYFKSKYFDKINTILLPIFQSLTLLFIAVFLLSGFLGYGLLHKSISAGLIVLAFILMDSSLSYTGKIAKFFVSLGDYSYSVYLCHVLILGAVLNVFGNQLGMIDEFGVIVLIIILVHITSVLSYNHVENGTASNKLKRMLIK
tara:strand:- start:196122 stop:197153 length:1032 start_codon:yes stop_codon:yes gene_type:complete